MNQIIPNYNSKEEWRMDPKGYFIIKVFYKENKLGVRHYTPDHKPTNEIYGEDAYKIIMTIIREDLVSSMQHAAYLGHELHRAEIALKQKLEYIQDKNLDFSKPTTKDVSENVEKK